jgi:hypothetical protein
MNSERIKEIQAETAYPQSISVHKALLKVWNECEQKQERSYSEEEVLKAQQAILCNIKDALMNENYIIEYLNNLKTNKI